MHWSGTTVQCMVHEDNPNYTKHSLQQTQANHFRDNGDHIQAKIYSRRSLFCTSLAINLFTVTVILFLVGVGFAIDNIIKTVRGQFYY